MNRSTYVRRTYLPNLYLNHILRSQFLEKETKRYYRTVQLYRKISFLHFFILILKSIIIYCEVKTQTENHNIQQSKIDKTKEARMTDAEVDTGKVRW